MDEEQNTQQLKEEMIKVFEDILENTKDIAPDLTKLVDEHFWELT